MMKNIIIFSIPFLLFACSTLKSVEDLTDKELVDKYYETDLKLYMAKRAIGSHPTNTNLSKEYTTKISKIERKLEIMRQELVKRGYIP